MFRFLLCLSCFCVITVTGQNLSTSLTACYPLNGNGNEPVNLLTGTLSAVTPTVDRFNTPGAALAFSGSSSSYVRLPNSALIKPTNALSVSMWMRPGGLGLRHVLFAHNGCGASGYFEAYCVALMPSGLNTKFSIVKASSACSPGGQLILPGSTNVSVNTWYHIGAYFGTDSIKLYVNGVLEAAAASPVPFAYSSADGVVVGGTIQSNWNYPYLGTIDNLRFYNRKLNGSEFLQLYQNDPACAAMPVTTASFGSGDTACVNQPFSLQNNSTGTISSYYWQACNSTATSAVVASALASSLPSGPVFTTLKKDGNDYYMFATTHQSGSLLRLFFGNNLSNTPTVTNLGTFGGALPLAEDLHIQKEGNTWYGLIVGIGGSGAYLTKMNFGSSLGNTPTLTNVGNIGNMSAPHAIHVFEALGNYYALVINQGSNSISRLNFGNSIANTPTGVNMSSVFNASFSSAVQMQVVSFNGNWHIFVLNDSPFSTITRLDFGNSLLNVPTATLLGNPGGLLNGPRGMVLYPDCGGFRGLISNRNTNQIVSVSISGGATGPLTLSPSGISSTLNFPHDMIRARWSDTSMVFIPNANGNFITKLKFIPTCTAIPSSTLQSPGAITFPSSGTYTITLATNENLPDQSFYCKQITVIPQLTISAMVSPSTGCTVQQRTLTATGATSYTWYPGSLTGSSVLVTPTSNVVYTVVGSNGRCTAQHVFTVFSTPGTTISLVASPGTVCPGFSSTLTATGAMSYSWQPGSLTGSQVSVAPSVSTVFTVTGSQGPGCQSTRTVAVAVAAVPAFSIFATSNSICAGASTTLFTSPSIPVQWGTGGLTSSIVVSPTISTNYVASINTGGCSKQAQLLISVGNTLVPSISSTATQVCRGTAVQLIGLGASSFTWLPGNIKSSTFTVTPVSTTSYTLYAATPAACTGSAAITIEVQNGPNINVLLPPAFCAGQEVPVSFGGALSFSLNGLAMPGNSITVAPATSTQYTVSGWNGSGCISTEVFVMTPMPVPKASIVPAHTVICSGDEIILSAGSTGPFEWLPEKTAGPSLAVSPGVSTTYTLVAGANACTTAAVATVVVFECGNANLGLTNAASQPLLHNGNFYLLSYSVVAVNGSTFDLSSVEISNDLSFTFPPPLSYTIMEIPYVSNTSRLKVNPYYDGSLNRNVTLGPGSSLTANSADTVVLRILIDPGQYSGPVSNWATATALTPWSLLLSDSSNAGFLWDPDRDGDPRNNNQPTVTELPEITLFIPDAFSPDGDGKYDELVVKGLQGRHGKLTVFNRWGSKVFETAGSDLRWNGFANTGMLLGNDKVPPATYFYVLELQDKGGPVMMRGFVVVRY